MSGVDHNDPSWTAADQAWIERVQEVVAQAHAENFGGKHVSGFCEACADAYLVAQYAVPRRNDEQKLREWVGATLMMIELGATDSEALRRIVETGQALLGTPA